MTSTSVKRGTFSNIDLPGLNMQAAIMGRAEFLAPCTAMVPEIALPP
jgi:hypothetical protein